MKSTKKGLETHRKSAKSTQFPPSKALCAGGRAAGKANITPQPSAAPRPPVVKFATVVNCSREMPLGRSQAAQLLLPWRGVVWGLRRWVPDIRATSGPLASGRICPPDSGPPAGLEEEPNRSGLLAQEVTAAVRPLEGIKVVVAGDCIANLATATTETRACPDC